jgi:hypothetical protein
VLTKYLSAWGAAALLIASACGSTIPPFENLMGIEVCDPSTQTFTAEVDNPFFPLPVGHRLVLEANGLFTDELVRVTVLPETETVAGVQTRVMEEYEAKDGRVVEISRNFFAQTASGYVCYFGEDVDIYDSEGNVASHLGAWRADGDRNMPGIFMPPEPTVGLAFPQEIAPGVAEDEAMITALGGSVDVPAGSFDDTVTIVDRNPLDGSSDQKVYARGIGLIVDASAQLTSIGTA